MARKIDRISAGVNKTWWGAREVPRFAVIPAAALVVGMVALFNGAFAKAPAPAAPVAQTAPQASPAP